jgi:hypothetical protein
MWDKMVHEIKKVAKATLGESRGFGPRVRNLSGGMIVFRVKFESKDIVLKISLGVKMPKLEINIGYL